MENYYKTSKIGFTKQHSYFGDKCFYAATGSIILFSIILMAVYEFIFGIAIMLSYAMGCVGIHIILRMGDRHVPNIVFLLKRKSKIINTSVPYKICNVCGKVECRRHRPELNTYEMKPWMDLKIPQEIDQAVEEILELIFKRYVYTWYSTISNNEAFIQEMRIFFRFLIATFLRRAQQVDLVQLITGKLSRALLQHLDCFLHGHKRTNTPEKIQQAVLSYFGSNLHVAMKSREMELQYLRQLTENLLPYVMHRKYLQCRSACTLLREIFTCSVFLPVMDIVADPDIINHLLIIFFDKTPLIEYPSSQEPKVELLSNFVMSHKPPHNQVLHTDLKTVLGDQQLLYKFMQFLKEEASVNVLQFVLSVDDFSTQILNPELSKEDLEALHIRAQEIYNNYFALDAVDRIGFDEKNVEQIKEILSGPPENVVQLRTTRPLFEAYDYAYSLLEQTYCPMFLQSDGYFSMLCGERWSTATSRHFGKGGKRGLEQSSMSKLGHKIKGVFTTNIDDGQIYVEEAGTDLTDVGLLDSAFNSHSEADGYRIEDDPRLKNLSAWRVSIPQVATRLDNNCKYYDTFVIDVQRIDVRDDDNPNDLHWTVERKYTEFYILEAKLTEFHGELSIHLPPKRFQGNRGKQFLESRRYDFEKFLQTLLTLPSLQGSELLYKFLKTRVQFTSGFLQEINLGKMIKTVPMRLIKEKGQHLYPFLQAFLASTEAAKPKPSKLDWKEIHESPSSPDNEKLKNPLFGDNMAQFRLPAETNVEIYSKTIITLEGIYDYILYLAVCVYKVSDWCVQLLATFDVLVRQSLQSYIEWYLEKKLHQVLKPQRIVEVIHLLRDVLFFDNEPPRTKKQKSERARLALTEAKGFFPDFLIWILGSSRHSDGTTLLFNVLQYSLLNKQLSYVLLDIVVLELFPELQLNRATPSPE